MNRAVFLDRDGVIIVDADLITRIDQIHVIDGVPEALSKLKRAGFLLIIVSNQPVVARGLISEHEVKALQNEVERRIVHAGGCGFDGFFFCPHHPKANIKEYRLVCDCRKPAPGLILKAASDNTIDVALSYMIGDRITDIIAGKNAGCSTVQVLSGMHAATPIQTSSPIDSSIKPDHICSDLLQASAFILNKK
jgi:D-glycero-D-manno-heptose 1,7-bisphosphate phosphatase